MADTGVEDADVIVVGAGPAGCSAATHLADAGIDVVLLDKATFPRDKTCGDGLTPRAVGELRALGVPTDSSWARNRGLRVYGGGHVLELDWPAGGTYPSYGLTKPRADFDQALLDRARAAGARVHQATTVTHPELNPAGRVVGVAARQADGRTVGWRAPITLAADGVAARLALAVGRERRPNRPMGIALRTYFRVPQVGEYMESHLELWDGPPGQGRLMPGYGWVFPLADGRVNVGLGTVSSRANTANVNFRDMLERWVPNIPGWRFDPADQLAPPRSAALPMAFNRVPLYGDGLLLLGDAGGMVSPFNGEGIAQAMASGRIAAQTCLGALACRTAAGREQALAAYPRAMADYAGGYFALGRVFVRLIEHPGVMRVCTRYGLGRPTLMKFTMKLLSGLYEPRGGDWMDRMIAALTRLAPAA